MERYVQRIFAQVKPLAERPRWHRAVALIAHGILVRTGVSAAGKHLPKLHSLAILKAVDSQ
ncbi:hypothetical protein SDC9_83282 [bioreactor metagenome]|uniref:Uncharacterized protein n=1 Tax=bioreactor metagenome TaxID=1076179 RepID=A0A644Z7A3_9ZZZZ